MTIYNITHESDSSNDSMDQVFKFNKTAIFHEVESHFNPDIEY